PQPRLLRRRRPRQAGRRPADPRRRVRSGGRRPALQRALHRAVHAPDGAARVRGERRPEARLPVREVRALNARRLRKATPSRATSPMTKSPATAIEAAGREVVITNPEKVFFPKAGYTKLDLARYYLSVAEGALRGIAGRPIVLKRYVDGAEGEPFYQKR